MHVSGTHGTEEAKPEMKPSPSADVIDSEPFVSVRQNKMASPHIPEGGPVKEAASSHVTLVEPSTKAAATGLSRSIDAAPVGLGQEEHSLATPGTGNSSHRHPAIDSEQHPAIDSKRHPEVVSGSDPVIGAASSPVTLVERSTTAAGLSSSFDTAQVVLGHEDRSLATPGTRDGSHRHPAIDSERYPAIDSIRHAAIVPGSDGEDSVEVGVSSLATLVVQSTLAMVLPSNLHMAPPSPIPTASGMMISSPTVASKEGTSGRDLAVVLDVDREDFTDGVVSSLPTHIVKPATTLALSGDLNAVSADYQQVTGSPVATGMEQGSAQREVVLLVDDAHDPARVAVDDKKEEEYAQEVRSSLTTPSVQSATGIALPSKPNVIPKGLEQVTRSPTVADIGPSSEQDTNIGLESGPQEGLHVDTLQHSPGDNSRDEKQLMVPTLQSPPTLHRGSSMQRRESNTRDNEESRDAIELRSQHYSAHFEEEEASAKPVVPDDAIKNGSWTTSAASLDLGTHRIEHEWGSTARVANLDFSPNSTHHTKKKSGSVKEVAESNGKHTSGSFEGRQDGKTSVASLDSSIISTHLSPSAAPPASTGSGLKPTAIGSDKSRIERSGPKSTDSQEVRTTGIRHFQEEFEATTSAAERDVHTIGTHHVEQEHGSNRASVDNSDGSTEIIHPSPFPGRSASPESGPKGAGAASASFEEDTDSTTNAGSDPFEKEGSSRTSAANQNVRTTDTRHVQKEHDFTASTAKLDFGTIGARRVKEGSGNATSGADLDARINITPSPALAAPPSRPASVIVQAGDETTPTMMTIDDSRLEAAERSSQVGDVRKSMMVRIDGPQPEEAGENPQLADASEPMVLAMGDFQPGAGEENLPGERNPLERMSVAKAPPPVPDVVSNDTDGDLIVANASVIPNGRDISDDSGMLAKASVMLRDRDNSNNGYRYNVDTVSAGPSIQYHRRGSGNDAGHDINTLDAGGTHQYHARTFIGHTTEGRTIIAPDPRFPLATIDSAGQSKLQTGDATRDELRGRSNTSSGGGACNDLQTTIEASSDGALNEVRTGTNGSSLGGIGLEAVNQAATAWLQRDVIGPTVATVASASVEATKLIRESPTSTSSWNTKANAKSEKRAATQSIHENQIGSGNCNTEADADVENTLTGPDNSSFGVVGLEGANPTASSWVHLEVVEPTVETAASVGVATQPIPEELIGSNSWNTAADAEKKAEATLPCRPEGANTARITQSELEVPLLRRPDDGHSRSGDPTTAEDGAGQEGSQPPANDRSWTLTGARLTTLHNYFIV